MSFRSSSILLAVLCVAWTGQTTAPHFDRLLGEARAAAARGDLASAISRAGRAIRADPKRTEGLLLRAELHTRRGSHPLAVKDYASVLKLEPSNASAWQRRGEAEFRAARFAESVASFDAFLRLAPNQMPHHWQRGISLYYAGRFADGKSQFELHQTVNPEDVENAVWHFLCTARAEGITEARRQLIPIRADPRVPMAEVHRLFAGKGTREDVLNAAQAAGAGLQGGEPLFYAHLYLGLHAEATGDRRGARDHIGQAAAMARENGYMGDVARVHHALLKRRNNTAREAPMERDR
jgi:lipoprotein NlpI